MQLGHDNPFRTIDDKGSALGHQGDFTHVNFLLLNIFDCLRGRFLIIKNQAHLDSQRYGVGGAPQLTFFNVKCGLP